MDVRETLVDIIQNSVGGCARNWAEVIADGLIAHGVTFKDVPDTNVGEWISVEDMLPSREDLERSQFHNFLVVNEFGEVREAVFTGKYFAKLGSRLSGVTHWMPLPQPPKGE